MQFIKKGIHSSTEETPAEHENHATMNAVQNPQDINPSTPNQLNKKGKCLELYTKAENHAAGLRSTRKTLPQAQIQISPLFWFS